MEEQMMNPYAAEMLAKGRVDELLAEAEADRLVAQVKMAAKAESPCRAEAARRPVKVAVPQIDCSWIDRLWAFIRRTLQVRTA
jgi:hypothetical protein